MLENEIQDNPETSPPKLISHCDAEQLFEIRLIIEDEDSEV